MSYYDDASLVLIPSGVKAAKVYSQKPTNGNGDLTFSRASTATRTNASGLIEAVASNVPRLDYSGGATCPRLLLEPQRTNLVLYSEQFDNAFWLKGNASTISANATTSPDGTLSADKHVSANNGVAFALGWTNASVVSGTVYTFSVYLKRSEVRFVQLRNNISGNLFCNFDLELGVAGTPSAGLTASISNAGSGWYRCVITSTSGGTATAGFLINMANSITDGLAPTYIGNGVNGYFVWGAQVEVGSFVSSYIPTTTAAVTRLADTFTRSNVFTNGLISSAGGTWFVEISDNASVLRDNGSGLFIGDTAFANNGNQIIIRSAAPAAAARFSIIRYISGTATTLHTTTTNKIKVAVKWNGSVMDVFVNGVKVSASNLFTTTTMQNMIAGAGQIFEIDQMFLAPTPLSDAECIERTTL